jgi:hypothetical protein
MRRDNFKSGTLPLLYVVHFQEKMSNFFEPTLEESLERLLSLAFL